MAFDHTDTTTKGAAFEARVATLLRLFGYEVEANLNFRSSQIDLRAIVQLPTHRDVLLVECKDHEKPSGVEDVRSFYAIIADEPHDVRGLFVTTAGFTADAKTFGNEKARLSLSTFRELERRVLNPCHYLEKINSEYPRSEIAEYYVDLRCSISNATASESSENTVLHLLNDDNIRMLAILGEYGSGKSTLLDRLEYRLSSTYLASSTGRLPIKLNLGEYTKALNLRQLITDVLVHRFGVRNPRFDFFEEVNKLGQLVLLLDGFDEMSTRVDDIVVRENFQEIQRLCDGNAKIVVSCRNSFFRDRDEEISLLGVDRDLLQESIEGSRGDGYARIQLEPLDPELIERLVTRFACKQKKGRRRRVDVHDVLHRIRSTYNLEELAQRPFLLDMILRSVPHMGASLRTLTPGVLYEIYTNRWVVRDAQKGRILETPERRLFFAQELAYEMYANQYTLLHWSRIPDWIDKFLGVSDKLRDHYDYDVRTSNFLTRNERGFYHFAHRSFLEFFTARKIASVVGQGELFYVLQSVPLTEEIRLFAVNIGGNAIAAELSRLIGAVKLGAGDQEARYTRTLARNFTGLVRMLGPIRVVTPLVSYLRDGSDRAVKLFATHYLGDSLNATKDPTGMLASIAGVSVAIHGPKVRLSPSKINRLWKRAPKGFFQSMEFALSVVDSVKGVNNYAVDKILNFISIGKKPLYVSSAEVAFAFGISEDELLEHLRRRREL